MSEQPVAGAAPFRLIVHIGAGKTGTSSIQHTLTRAKELLRNSGTVYVGLNFEYGTRRIYPWQKSSGFREFRQLNNSEKQPQLRSVINAALEDARASGATQLIWSNEALFNQSEIAIPILSELANAGIDVSIVCYVRRHDSWARSSYIQWGIKHKTFKGELPTFEMFCKRRPPKFVTHLEKWHRVFGEALNIRNVDAVGDSARDFLTVAGVNSVIVEFERRNESLAIEELALRAIFNSQFEGSALVTDFTDAMGGIPIPVHKSIDELLKSLLPTEEELSKVIEEQEEDRNTLDQWLAGSGQPPIETSPLPPKSNTADLGRVTAALAHIVMRQATRLQKLEKRLDEMPAAANTPPPLVTAASARPKGAGKAMAASPAIIAPVRSDGAAPVFAISTGRSGSTLVQRILNCHKDLVVWGEHYGFIGGMAPSYAQMTSPDQRLYPAAPSTNKGPGLLLPTLNDPAVAIEWSNPWSAQEFKDHLRQFIDGYFGSRLQQGQRWGFKEIRYNNLPALQMLHELYPHGRFVFIRRDIEEVTRSKISAFVKEARWSVMAANERQARVRKFILEVREHYQVYDDFMARHPAIGMATDFEELVEQPKPVIDRLLAHLDLDPGRFDWNLADQVLASIITRTKRDPEIIEFIHKVTAMLSSDDTVQDRM